MTVLEPIEHTNRDFVGSLAKGCRVLSAFNNGMEKMTVSDVAKLTELSRAGARRLLLTLHALGYMHSDGKYYSLSPKVLELGFSYLSSQNWLVLSSPILERLREELDEAVSVTVLKETDVVYVARFQTDRVMTMAMEIGSQRPAYCTAMGRVLLGALPQTKAREVLLASDLKSYTPHTL
ncbi:MAG: helix-turn-helix domain-containing protein, partial [Gammaproteobacteria bacterium]|nr:helix-turn-helix domain-containing protein [Gammaproteobacteria bacterium]